MPAERATTRPRVSPMPDDRAPSAGAAPAEDWIVVIRAHTRCGLACRFCGYSRTLAGPRRDIDLPRLNPLGPALARFALQTGRSVLVSWLGGEPLDTPELLPFAAAWQERHGLRLSVTTNGLPLASSAVRRELVRCWEQVTISVDGPEDIHDRVRGRSGLFRTLERDILRLRAADARDRLTLRVNTVLMADNIEQFPEFCARMAAWGIHELSFNPLGGRERPDFHAGHRLRPEPVERFIAEFPGVRAEMARRGVRLLGSDAWLARLRASAALCPAPIADCEPGRSFLFVDECGMAAPCAFTTAEYGLPVEDLLAPGALSALVRHWDDARRRSRARACDDCHATHPFAKFQPVDAPARPPASLARPAPVTIVGLEPVSILPE